MLSSIAVIVVFFLFYVVQDSIQISIFLSQIGVLIRRSEDLPAYIGTLQFSPIAAHCLS